ncbi:MAG: hypothetical protein ACI8Z1_000227 [Candidatus Azotimanducaceae bacterium]|jgi:uncharacterized protein YbjQ (UPF0145 family)
MDYINLIIVVTMVTVGYVFGRIAEKKHFRSLIEREETMRSLLTFSERYPPIGMKFTQSHLVGGNVVISIDYFKHLAASLRMLLGGRVAAYESLVERARREALLRMKEDAKQKGASIIINVKLETASISKGAQGQVGSVEVYAYGTALIEA